jgi:cysteine desulfurase
LDIALDLQGLACSAAAACLSGAVDPSHVLAAIGLSTAEARGSIRLSLGRTTSDQDVDLAVEMIPEAVARQRELLPVRREAAEAVSRA